jgi:catechol 2,3-dioxygenase-like lactoylglutathione lyase family enzyme
MEHTISKLLSAYEGGKLHRRELVKGLALLAAASSTASAANFPAAGINHISLYVSDLDKSGQFYAAAFASKAIKRKDGTVAVTVGKGRIVLRKGTPVAKVDHIAIGLDNFNKEGLIAEMKMRGTPTTESGDAGLHITDPDGYPVQLIAGDAA